MVRYSDGELGLSSLTLQYDIDEAISSLFPT